MKPGDVVVDRFEVEQLAGQGGMGAVFRAKDRQTGEIVALKSLTDPGGNHIDRFQREAQVLHDLHHPGIVRYVAHGRTKAGELYMAMEWVDGESISQRGAREPYTVREATQVVLQIARALGEAHRQGVIHRDIKPSNLFLRRGTLEVKVLDFGIARLNQAARLTGLGMMLGTPGYMAPEQARGAATVDSRADIFSLGCVFYKCLTGRPPFMSEDVRTVLAQVLFDPAPPVSSLRPEVPPALDGLVARMLAKKPPDRPTDGDAIANELELIYPTLLDLPAVPVGAVSFAPPAPKPVPPPPPPRLPSRQSRPPAPYAAATAKEIPIIQFQPGQGAAPSEGIQAAGAAAPDGSTTVERSPFASLDPQAIPTGQGESPFASPAVVEVNTGPVEAPAPGIVWEAPTFVRAAEEIPEAPEVVEALHIAREALQAGDLKVAREAVGRGSERVQGPIARGALLARMSEAQLWSGDLDGAVAQATAALTALALDHPDWGVAAAVLARASAWRGDTGKLDSLAYLLLEMDSLRAPPTLYAAAIVCLELLRAHEVDLAERLQGPVRASSHAEEDIPLVKAALIHLSGSMASARGDFSEGIRCATAASLAFLGAGAPFNNRSANLDGALWAALLGHFESADSLLADIQLASQRSGAQWLEARATRERAQVACHMGRLDEALELAEEALELAEDPLGPMLSGQARLTLAAIFEAQGRREDATTEMMLASVTLTDGASRAAISTLRSRLTLAKGTKAEAMELARAAVAWFDQNPRVGEGEMDARLALARALFACGLNDAGRQELGRACERLRIRTAAIGDGTHRSSFLTRIGVHRHLLELAAWWLGQAVG